MVEIRCPVSNGLVVIDLTESEIISGLFCPFCNLRLDANGGNFKHPTLPFELEEINSNLPGGRGRGIILIHGFLNTRRDSYSVWINSLRTAGWKGSIFGFWWDAGNPMLKHLVCLMMLLGHPGVKIGAALYLKEVWDKARREADNTGRLFGKYLMHNRPRWTRNKLILMSFSLGTHVTCRALEAGRNSNKFIADEAFLYGGAFPIRAPWPTIAGGVRTEIHNHFSNHDEILRYLYPLGVKKNERPSIGLHPINSKSPKIKDWDVSDFVQSHGDYERAIGIFENFD